MQKALEELDTDKIFHIHYELLHSKYHNVCTAYLSASTIEHEVQKVTTTFNPGTSDESIIRQEIDEVLKGVLKYV